MALVAIWAGRYPAIKEIADDRIEREKKVAWLR
jgi:hypothetical protein